MEISSLHIANDIVSINSKNVNSTEDNQFDKSDRETMIGSIEYLIQDKVIYQNPFLMAVLQANLPGGFQEYQPDMVEEYKINPIKAIYDSNKAHD